MHFCVYFHILTTQINVSNVSELLLRLACLCHAYICMHTWKKRDSFMPTEEEKRRAHLAIQIGFLL